MTARRIEPPIDRVLRQIAVTETGCWEFTGYINADGYGVTFAHKSNGEKSKKVAHRVVYEAQVGPIPAGLDLDHLCRNRKCCNPEHLEPVTRRINLLRGQTLPARWAARTHCESGHEFAGANLKMYRGYRVCLSCERAKWQRKKTAA